MVLTAFVSRFGEVGRVVENFFRDRFGSRLSQHQEELITLPFTKEDIGDVSGLFFKEKEVPVSVGDKENDVVPAGIAQGETVVILPVTGDEIKQSGIIPEGKPQRKVRRPQADTREKMIVAGEGGSNLL